MSAHAMTRSQFSQSGAISGEVTLPVGAAGEAQGGDANCAISRSDFEIVTEPGNGTTAHSWTVRAIWHGSRRIVFVGSVFQCCRFVREQLEGVA